jgi:hypothetical protein
MSRTNRGEVFAIASQDVSRGRQGASTNKVATLHDDPAQGRKEFSNAGLGIFSFLLWTLDTRQKRTQSLAFLHD